MVGDVTHIIIIESLINERLTGEEIYNDCIRRRIDFLKKPITHKYYSAHTKNDLSELLKYYQINSTYMTGGILIHLEMHGDKNLKGLILSDNTLVTWTELANLFRPINIATCNKLFITMATCNGRYLYLGVDPYQKSPYLGYISASKAVYPNEIVDKFSLLFEGLIESGNLVNAYLDMEKTGSNFYYKDSKATFEDAIKDVLDKFNNVEYKTKFMSESIAQAQQLGKKPPNKEDGELLFRHALHNIYLKQKQAFDFSDCD